MLYFVILLVLEELSDVLEQLLRIRFTVVLPLCFFPSVLEDCCVLFNFDSQVQLHCQNYWHL